jgi:RNA polymerase primary sigma factor
MEKIRKDVEGNLCREATVHELAEELDMDDDEVKYLKSISQEMLSLDASRGELSESNMMDFIEDENTDLPEKELLNASLAEMLNSVLVTLTKPERSVLELRFGLNGNSPMSLSQIGEKFNLTKERIRQIEKKAIRRLRHSPECLQLKNYLL